MVDKKVENTEDLLSKPIKDLTKEERHALAKHIGTRGRPYPMVGPRRITTSEGNEVVQMMLGVLEDDEHPLTVYSERSFEEVIGMAYREMPTPSMLPMFFEALSRRKLDSTNNTQLILGEPGAGKSYMAKLIGRMRSKKGALVIDCGGRNANDLLYETVLDTEHAVGFYDELDKRLAEGTLNDMSMRMLREGLGDAMTEEKDGRASVDWARVGEPRRNPQDNEGEESREQAMQRAMTALKRVAENEGLNSQAGSALGFTTKEGPLLIALKEGRELVGDEYTKTKDGSDDQLQTVLQFLTGEIDEHTVENKLKDNNKKDEMSFHLSRDMMKPGFFFTMTGNLSKDGTSTRALSKSVNSRLDPQVIPEATIEDWQHRLCQIMTGLPISTLYNSASDQWEKDPEAFTQMLKFWRTVGLDEDEQKNIPALQMKWIDNWQNVLQATENLARFLYGWSQMVDPNSDLMERPELADMLDEIDEEYMSEVSIDFRKLIKHVELAYEVRPEVKPPEESQGYEIGNWSDRPLEDAPDEDPGLQVGTRLVDDIITRLHQTTFARGKRRAGKRLMQLATDHGLVAPALKEGRKSDRPMVSDLLNINNYRDPRPDVQLKTIQEAVADYLRERFPEIQADNETIVPKHQLEKILEGLDDQETLTLNARENLVHVLNVDHETLTLKPFNLVATKDATPGPDANDNVPALEDLVDHEQLVASIALPKLGKSNLEAFFNTAMSASGLTSGADDTVKDEALAIAENRSGTGFSATTLMAARFDGGSAKPVTLHVVRNKDTDQTVIVGEKVSTRLQGIFKNMGMTYIDRSSHTAKSRLQTAMRNLTAGKEAKDIDSLKQAFLMRNSAADESGFKDKSLADLMLDSSVSTHLPNFVTSQERKRPAPKPPAPKPEAA